MALGNILELITMAIGHPVKKKITDLLLKNKEMTISDLQKKIKGPEKKNYNYRTIWQHVKGLEKKKVVVLKKHGQKKGKPVMVSLSPSFEVFLSAVERKT